MNTDPQIFICHSLQDGRDKTLAHQLAEGLRNQGFKVWIAPDNIPSGSEWKKEIINSIVRQCTHFLVILSASSVSSEWVLEEIELARQRHEKDNAFTILPLAFGALNNYKAKDFINRFQALPYRTEVADQLKELIAVLPQKNETGRNEMFITDFVGREHVYTAFEKFKAANKHGCFTIVGDPGEGKSTILMEYARRNACVAHFNKRAEGNNHARHCISHIAAQLKSLFGIPIQPVPLDPAEFSAYWLELFRQASESVERKDQQEGVASHMVIVIDGLDEVDRAADPEGVNVLFLPRYLPKGIFLLLSKRREILPFVNDAPQQVFDLKDFPEQNRKDIEAYISKKINEDDALNQWIDERQLKPADFVQQLADSSENNFMYLHYILPDIANGLYSKMSPDKLPVGLQGYYEDHWRRMGMQQKPLPQLKLRTIYVMSVMRRPVSRQMLSNILQQDATVIQSILDEWSPFLHQQLQDAQLCYSIYHSSFLDFLYRKDIIQATGESIEDFHKMISAELLKGLKRK
ncbi:MAG: toll/interleukin-1 receptor domain-containing protein [Chitinophagaceae bacterium]